MSHGGYLSVCGHFTVPAQRLAYRNELSIDLNPKLRLALTASKLKNKIAGKPTASSRTTIGNANSIWTSSAANVASSC